VDAVLNGALVVIVAALIALVAYAYGRRAVRPQENGRPDVPE
jgi:hypothetical protein